MKTALYLSLLMIVHLITTASAQTNGEGDVEKGLWIDDPVCQTVFFAVLEGLYTEGVSNEIVDLIVPPDPKTREPVMTEHFVYACPLCHPAFDALRLYRSRKPFHGLKPGNLDTFGQGPDETLVARLRSDQKSERLAAVQSLIEEWISRRLDSMRLTPDERKEWQRRLEARRQQGIQRLKAFQATEIPENWPEEVKQSMRDSPFRKIYEDWKGCAVCDGSAAACKIR